MKQGYTEPRDSSGVAPNHSKAALEASAKKTASNLSNAEIKPSDKKRYQELEELYGLDENDAKLIEAEVGAAITEIVEEDWGRGSWVKEYSFDNEQKWFVFDNEKEAEGVAISRVEEDVEDNPEWFPSSILTEHVNAKDAEARFREMYDEQNTGYVNDIEDEDDEEYTNRLAREMHGRDIITYEEATNESFSLDDKKEEMIEDMTTESINEGNYGFDYYKFNFGDIAALKILKDWNLVDTEEIAKTVVRIDGIGHILSGYDGLQVDLDNGMVMYRTD